MNQALPQKTVIEDFVKKLASGLSLTAAALSAAGFLAARSAINALGLPTHVEISLEAYLQYGGRFAFTFLVHLLIIGLGFYTLFLVWQLVRRIGITTRRLSPRILTAGLALLSLATVALELLLIDVPPLLAAESLAAAVSTGDAASIQLLAIEALTVAAVAWRLRLSRPQAAEPEAKNGRHPWCALLWLLVTIQVILVPVCFGKVWLVPCAFPQVRLSLTGGNDAAAEGALLYRDTSDYYLWNSGSLLQVARSEVNEVHYRSYQHVVTTCSK